MVGRCCCLRLASLTFITRVGFSTSTLARTLDSLVRVSRRVDENPLVSIANMHITTSPSVKLCSCQYFVLPTTHSTWAKRKNLAAHVINTSIQHMVGLQGYNSSEEPTFLTAFSHTSNWCWRSHCYRARLKLSNESCRVTHYTTTSFSLRR